MEKNFIKRSCDSPLCDTTEIIPQGEEMTGSMAQILAHWSAGQVHEAVPIPDPRVPAGSIGSGKWMVKPTLKLACRAQCAINILKTETRTAATTESEDAKTGGNVPAVTEG